VVANGPLRSLIAPGPLRGQPAGTAAALTLKPGSTKVRNGPRAAAAFHVIERELV
jgi:hypothetical protein